MTAMLVTRPEPDASDTIARLSALDIEAIGLPLLERAALATSLPDPKGFAGLALTSANALRTLAERSHARAIDCGGNCRLHTWQPKLRQRKRGELALVGGHELPLYLFGRHF